MHQAAFDITAPLPLPPLFPEPETVRRGCDIHVTLPPAIRARFRYPAKVSISDWAEQHRIVTPIDSTPGPWRQDMVPHTKKIMDTIGKPWVREVWLCMVERSAKTQILLNAAMWFIDQGMKSGNIFWLMPTELDARTALGERIIPALRASNRTKRHLSERQDDTNRGMIRFKHGIRLKPAWSNSPSSLASYFGRFNIADEVDKFAERTSEGTDPITLFLKRSRDDKRGSKYLFASTPAQRFVYKGMQSCQQVWAYQVKCPSCGEYILMDADHFIIPQGVTVDTIIHADVAYACNACASIWTENDRRNAYLAGRWFAIKGADILRPETVGFHFPAFPCPMIPFAEIAGAKLKAATGGISEKSAWANGYEAIDYEAEATSSVTAEHLLQYRSEHPRNLVPTDTWRLCLLADTQQSSFYYQVWAYGYAPELRMHMVRHGIVEKFIDLEGLLIEEFTDINGTIHRISNGLIDSGGTRRGYQKHSRTVEVYEWCSRNRSMQPIKGMHGRQGDTVTYKEIESYPGTNRKVPGGIKRANLRVDLFKDELERRLQIQPDDRGALSFHDSIDDAFARHYTAEVKDESGKWQHNRKQRNDYWDCTVYAVALLEMMKLRIPKKAQPEQKAKTPTRSGGFVKGW